MIKSVVILLSRDSYVILSVASHITIIYGLFKVFGDLKLTSIMISHVTLINLEIGDYTLSPKNPQFERIMTFYAYFVI